MVKFFDPSNKSCYRNVTKMLQKCIRLVGWLVGPRKTVAERLVWIRVDKSLSSE